MGASGGLAYDPDSGDLYACFNSGYFCILDKNTGSATFLGYTMKLYGLAFAPLEYLSVDVNSISAQSGGIVQFMLKAGSVNQNRQYFLLGSVSGTSPGIHLPGGAATLQLNPAADTTLYHGALAVPTTR